MARYNFHVNGVDFTSYTTDGGYVSSPIKLDGGQGGMMLDGSETEDTIRVKMQITVPIMPLTANQLSTLQQALLEYDYPELYFFDSVQKTYREAETIVALPVPHHAGKSITGDEIWIIDPLVFREKG